MDSALPIFGPTFSSLLFMVVLQVALFGLLAVHGLLRGAASRGAAAAERRHTHALRSRGLGGPGSRWRPSTSSVAHAGKTWAAALDRVPASARHPDAVRTLAGMVAALLRRQSRPGVATFSYLGHRRLEGLLVLAGGLQETEAQTLANALPYLLAMAALPRRRVAAHALWAIGRGASDHGGAAVPLADLARTSTCLRLEIAWALGRVLGANVAQAAVLAHDPSARVRIVALSALGQAVPPHALGPLETAGLRPALLEAATDPDPAVRRAALGAGHLLDADGRWDLLAAALGDPAALERGGGPWPAFVLDRRAVALLLDRLAPRPAADTRAVLAMLVRVPPAALSAAALDRLAAAARTGPLARRAVALGLLGACGGARAARAVLPALDQVPLRKAAVHALIDLARAAFPRRLPPEVARAAETRFRHERDPAVTAALGELLALFGGQRTATLLLSRIPASPASLHKHLVDALAVLDHLAVAASIDRDLS